MTPSDFPAADVQSAPSAAGNTTSDVHNALRIYRLLGAGAPASGIGDEDMRFCVVPGDPWSKSRPRFARRGTYQPRDDAEAERRTALYLSQLARGRPFTGNVALGCVFYRSNHNRIDTDNLLKHVCDSATGTLWADDSQVTAIYGKLELDRDNPRTVVVVGIDVSTLRRGSDAVAVCEMCGKQYNIAGRPPRRFCTARCARTAINGVNLTELVACPYCGETFRRKTASQKFCSTPCARRNAAGRPKGQGHKHSCANCGGERKRAGSTLCRVCWLAGASTSGDAA